MKNKQATISHDIVVMGLGTLKAGTKLDVIKSNVRYIYLSFNNCTIRLSIKDVVKQD